MSKHDTVGTIKENYILQKQIGTFITCHKHWVHTLKKKEGKEKKTCYK